MQKNRGSEFRKWDLHYHSNKTVLNNQFDEENDYSQYYDEIENSEISVYGITDYFKFENIELTINNFKQKYPKSTKVLFPNIEFRLNQNVSNYSSGHVNFHLIFDNEIDPKKISSFIASLELDETKQDGTKRKIAELKSEKDFSSAIIDIKEIRKKLQSTFGNEKPYIKVYAANGLGGIRPNITDDKGSNRNGILSDEFDKDADFFFSNSQSRDYYLNLKDGKKFERYKGASPKACILGSDYHGDNSDNQLTKYTWIKADKSFEGLKQIIFEPNERTHIGVQKPYTKRDDLVIDYVLKENKKIFLNDSLNTIIGGRSTGKSTLLNSIAKSLYNKNFLNSNSLHTFDKDISIFWRGNSNSDVQGQIEFIPQEYMIRLAYDNELRSELIDKIIKSENKREIINNYDTEVSNLNQDIQTIVYEYLNIKSELDNLIRPEGDKEVISKKIEDCKDEKNELFFNLGSSKVEIADYNKCINSINALKHENNNKINENTFLKNKYKKMVILEKPENFNDLSIKNQIKINTFFEVQGIIIQNQWNQLIDSIVNDNNCEIQNNIASLNEKEHSDIMLVGRKSIENNKLIDKIDEEIKKEKNNLELIENFEKLKETLSEEMCRKEEDIVKKFNEYKNYREKAIREFEINSGNIKIKINFEQIDFEDKITYLHGRKDSNNKFIIDFNNLVDTSVEMIFKDSKLSFNKGKNINDLIRDIFKESWFKYNFEIYYEDVEFNNMSQGKKSFVILTLLLEFSNDKRPVLIDQPEDSLDNRAIYRELTKYLKDKKKERQIILVTHNPNIVVGADAENIIVANEHSDQNKNMNRNRFDYINGSLENSFVLNKKNSDFQYVLKRQGIREHVIEILEGGIEALEKRERKYSI